MQSAQRGPTTWKDMRENALKGAASWHTKTSINCEVSTLCIDDRQFEPEELEAVGDL